MKYKTKGITILSALRDIVIHFLPVKELSSRWIRALYGEEISFVFLTHPRDKNDIYKIFPLIKKMTKFIPESFILKFLYCFPCFVAVRVQSDQGINGFFISTPLLPEMLFEKRNVTLRNIEAIVKFIRKITKKRVYIGLAAWWPIVTAGGYAFNRYLEKNDRIIVTNGHCSTLASIYLSIHRILSIAKHPLNELKLLIVGVGKMGGAVAEVFNGRAKEIGLIDQNGIRLKRMATVLEEKNNHSKINTLTVLPDNFDSVVIPALKEYHIAVCTTSNIGYVVKEGTNLSDCIILDDARPEAFPRIFDKNRNSVVLEGGLMHIKGVTFDSDLGFGKENNVFGCLAEAFILSLDKSNTVKPTIGDIDYRNFDNFLKVCQHHEIDAGDFLCGELKIDDMVIKRIFENKSKKIKLR